MSNTKDLHDMSEMSNRGRAAVPRDNRARERQRVLTEAKMELLEARERGHANALREALRQHPAQADALLEFDLGLMAAAGYGVADADAPDVLNAAEAARARAFAAVFGASASQAASQAARSLQALRKARGVTLPGMAAALGLGMDVLGALEKGRIRAASVPQRLCDALAELLDTTAEQVNAALGVSVSPALRREQPGARTGAGASDVASQQLDFADVVLLSTSMTKEQRARWLAER